MKSFIEKMFFAPKWYHYPIIILLLPLSFIYGLFMLLRRKFTHSIKYDIPIISVGNLIVGGSGKTPFVIALASRYEDVTVISRGYGRQSRGLIEVSNKGEILTDVYQSGDEAMLMAISLPHASVIVSEDRDKAINEARKNGAKIILLDDAFSRVNIKKFDLLLEPAHIINYYTFPAGPFREFASTRRYADVIIKEKKDFYRNVTIENKTSRMVLVTAISNPSRLEEYLPHKEIVDKIYYDDHAYFDEKLLMEKLKQCDAKTLLVTQKDAVKLQEFALPLSIMKLKLVINDTIVSSVDDYINTFNNKD